MRCLSTATAAAAADAAADSLYSRCHLSLSPSSRCLSLLHCRRHSLSAASILHHRLSLSSGFPTTTRSAFSLFKAAASVTFVLLSLSSSSPAPSRAPLSSSPPSLPSSPAFSPAAALLSHGRRCYAEEDRLEEKNN
ncbi:unnamed protein product [Linum trigynum]|uniref:Uncharacterized protein n=1 Tax=Linum trigynum TaxID=586398 RepID=A0AAV2F928_9ROSI